jgi:hypothetical protein
MQGKTTRTEISTPTSHLPLFITLLLSRSGLIFIACYKDWLDTNAGSLVTPLWLNCVGLREYVPEKRGDEFQVDTEGKIYGTGTHHSQWLSCAVIERFVGCCVTRALSDHDLRVALHCTYVQTDKWLGASLQLLLKRCHWTHPHGYSDSMSKSLVVTDAFRLHSRPVWRRSYMLQCGSAKLTDLDYIKELSSVDYYEVSTGQIPGVA